MPLLSRAVTMCSKHTGSESVSEPGDISCLKAGMLSLQGKCCCGVYNSYSLTGGVA